MEQALAPLSAAAKETIVHLIGHTHIDMDWMWTWKDTVHCIRRDVKSVTDMMDDYPDITFTHSQVPTYQVVQEMDPDVFEKVRMRLKEGRWENAAATWVEGDLNMADGESVARHILYAADWSLANLGAKAKVLWEPDTFGHPGNMPQLAKLGELDCYFHMRCNPAMPTWPIRTWEGVDGTEIPAFSMFYGSNLQPEFLMQRVLNCKALGFKNTFHIWGLGDHGGGIPRFQIDILERYRNKPLIPTMKFSTIRQLLESVREENHKMPRNKGMTFSLFEGCFTTHALIKKYNRQCETALLTAEALCALAGLDRKTELRNAWTQMLFNHFHDIFDGAAVHDSYINAYDRAERSLAIARKATSDAAKDVVKASRSGRTLALINPLGFERCEPVEAPLPKTTRCLIDDQGNIVPVQRKDDTTVFFAEKIPAFGIKTCYIVTSKLEGFAPQNVAVNEEAHYYHVETPLASIRIHKESGTIGSYYDKRLKREFVGYGVPKDMTYIQSARIDLALNVFQLIDEAPNGMSAWLINNNLRQQNLLQNAEVSLVESGPVFARFKVVHKIRSSKIEQDILIYNQLPRIDFETTVDWREKGSEETGVPQLKVSFASSMSAPRARFEGPFFITERPADGMEQPTGKFVDVSGDECGFAIYNDSKHGCDVLGSRVRLTLLRNSYGPDPESDNGVHTMRFAFDSTARRSQCASPKMFRLPSQ